MSTNRAYILNVYRKYKILNVVHSILQLQFILDTESFSSGDPEKSNKLLLENFHNHLQSLHDHEIEISFKESKKFSDQIISRHRNKIPHLCPIVNTIEGNGYSKYIFLNEILTSLASFR